MSAVPTSIFRDSNRGTHEAATNGARETLNSSEAEPTTITLGPVAMSLKSSHVSRHLFTYGSEGRSEIAFTPVASFCSLLIDHLFSAFAFPCVCGSVALLPRLAEIYAESIFRAQINNLTGEIVAPCGYLGFCMLAGTEFSIYCACSIDGHFRKKMGEPRQSIPSVFPREEDLMEKSNQVNTETFQALEILINRVKEPVNDPITNDVLKKRREQQFQLLTELVQANAEIKHHERAARAKVHEFMNFCEEYCDRAIRHNKVITEQMLRKVHDFERIRNETLVPEYLQDLEDEERGGPETGDVKVHPKFADPDHKAARAVAVKKAVLQKKPHSETKSKEQKEREKNEWETFYEEFKSSLQM
ncbi:hypothetical protein L596_000799 [Steinernema carpocapsae]|uniref:Uncharacterized protein n=1 Tax=Steinernema carpocapsae TaxID=34508 RepID=A0A4U8ULH8_STECR|nr:hypothetical protein L596_000799 [Steinernema carpocapsae]